MRLEKLMERTTTLYGKGKSMELTRTTLLKALKITMIDTHRANKEITVRYTNDHVVFYGDLTEENSTYKRVNFAKETNKRVAEHMEAELKAYAEELNSKLEPTTILKDTERYTLDSNLKLTLKENGYTVDYDLNNATRFNQVTFIMDMTAQELRAELFGSEETPKQIIVRDRATIEQEIFNLEAVYPELPVFNDVKGNRKKYLKLSKEEKDIMDKSVEAQSNNLNKRRLLRAELLCITHRRAVEIILEEESDSVYLLVENVITTEGDYTVYDVGSKVGHDYVDQMTEQEWQEFKEDLNNPVKYEVAR